MHQNQMNLTKLLDQRLLKEIRFFVDRFHLSNHKDVGNYRQFYILIYFLIQKCCHENLNLDLDGSLKDINSSVCEQINSSIKSYCHMLSNMNEYRFAKQLLVSNELCFPFTFNFYFLLIIRLTKTMNYSQQYVQNRIKRLKILKKTQLSIMNIGQMMKIQMFKMILNRKMK